MTATILGIGILGIPLAYVQIGSMVAGVLMQIPFVLLCWSSVVVLISLVEKYGCNTYDELIQGETKFLFTNRIVFKLKY